MVIVAALGLTYIAFATEGGSENDPIVTKSFLEDSLEAFALKCFLFGR